LPPPPPPFLPPLELLLPLELLPLELPDEAFSVVVPDELLVLLELEPPAMNIRPTISRITTPTPTPP